MSTKETSTAAAVSVPGLRERKKVQTRQRIRREAYRLVAEQGYDATTVDQIAAAADVSRSTFFRYFPTKEDVVLTDEYDPAFGEALEARPADEPIVESIRHALTGSLAHVFAADSAELLFRNRLIFTIPALRARAMDEQLRTQDGIAALLAQRTGRDPADLELSCVAAAIIGVSTAVMRHWVQRGGAEDLVDLYDRHLDFLSHGLRL
ncbi:TetR family transcriptional regulator [Embleya sp. NBC_00896]|uniref:acyl-CoA-like ligand-binding transcription factor n=1 Tax=Embleya sp. NBC_00896 TaxID=2975961 RepID=UPI002F910E3D|nr:TetR family transcriptional regulator [Embleya sp. NBC_00896]